MAPVSERLEQVPGWGLVQVDDENPTSGHLYLPGAIAKAMNDQERKRSVATARRQYAAMIRQQQESRKRTGPGKFYNDLGLMVSQEASGNGLRKPLGSLSFSALHALGMVWIDRLIINARKNQARRFAQICEAPGEQLGFRCVHRKFKNVDFDTDTEDIRRRCKLMDDRLKAVTRPIHQNFADVLENLIEDELVYDRRVMIKPKGRGGQIVSYHMIDGTSIRPRLEVLAEWMYSHNLRDSGFAERQIQRNLLANPPYDISSGRERFINFLDAGYVQIMHEQIVDAWRDEDISVGIAHPSVRTNQWGYGTSSLEHSWGLSFMFMQAMKFNQNLFDVNYPDALLLIPGGYDEEGLGAFKRSVFDLDETEANARMAIISGVSLDGDEFKPEMLKLRDTPKDMLMTELIRFICNLKCAAYGMHPSEINVMPDGQGGAIVNVDQTQGDEIADATERGFHSLMGGQADFLTEALIVPDFDDLMYIVEGLDSEGEQATAARVESMATQSTYDELRAIRNQKALPKGIPTDPGDFVANPEYTQIIQMIQQQAQAEAQQSMGSYEQGNFGEPGGGPPGAAGGDADQQGATQGGPGGGGAVPGQPGGPGAGAGQPGTPVPGPPGGGGPNAGAGQPGPPGGAPAGRQPPPGRGKPNPLFRSIAVDKDARERWQQLVDGE